MEFNFSLREVISYNIILLFYLVQTVLKIFPFITYCTNSNRIKVTINNEYHYKVQEHNAQTIRNKFFNLKAGDFYSTRISQTDSSFPASFISNRSTHAPAERESFPISSSVQCTDFGSEPFTSLPWSEATESTDEV